MDTSKLEAEATEDLAYEILRSSECNYHFALFIDWLASEKPEADQAMFEIAEYLNDGGQLLGSELKDYFIKYLKDKHVRQEHIDKRVSEILSEEAEAAHDAWVDSEIDRRKEESHDY